MSSPDAPVSIPQWSHRHPRSAAFIAFFLVNTAVAALLALVFGDPYSNMQADWLTGWMRLEPFALLAGLLAIPFYGRWVYVRDHHARNQSVFRGCLIGFLLVPLTLLFRALWDVSVDAAMRQSAWTMWQDHGFAMSMEMSFLYLMFATIYSLLLPEVGGAVAGYLVWRLVGPEPA